MSELSLIFGIIRTATRNTLREVWGIFLYLNNTILIRRYFVFLVHFSSRMYLFDQRYNLHIFLPGRTTYPVDNLALYNCKEVVQ